MDYKKTSFGLGIFSIALGVTELFAARRIAKALEAEDYAGLVKGFGAREILTGVNLLAAPAASFNMWNRVAGDAMDLTALGFAANNAPRNKAVWGAITFVVATTLLDVFTAHGLDTTTGKTSPHRITA